MRRGGDVGCYRKERYAVKKAKGVSVRGVKSAKKGLKKLPAKAQPAPKKKRSTSPLKEGGGKGVRAEAVALKRERRVVRQPAISSGTQEKSSATPLPARAPLRKIIREGGAIVVDDRQQRREGVRADLQEAWGRFCEVAAGPAIGGRAFADFWLGEGPLPDELGHLCRDLRARSVADIVAEFDVGSTQSFIESLHRAAGAAVEPPPEMEQRKALRSSVPLEPTWRSDKPNYPLHARAFLGLVEWHCRLAGAWPFAFARFMGKVPQRIGSDEFLALSSSFERPAAQVGELHGWSAEEVRLLMNRGREQLVGLFEHECPDVHRQWNIALRGAGVAVDHLVQRYLVDALNREFQMLLGRMTAQAMGPGLPSENAAGTNRWSVGAVA